MCRYVRLGVLYKMYREIPLKDSAVSPEKRENMLKKWFENALFLRQCEAKAHVVVDRRAKGSDDIFWTACIAL